MALRVALALAATASASSAAISRVCAGGDDRILAFAAREAQRYLKQITARGGVVPEVVSLDGTLKDAAAGDGLCVFNRSSAIAAGLADAALPAATSSDEAYTISLNGVAPGVHAIVGSSSKSALWGVYTYLEQLGYVFTSAGVSRPMPREDTSLQAFPGGATTLTQAPIFTTARGLQPFHDFSEGPDWWSATEHKRVLESLLRMKGNSIAFHTYPYDPQGDSCGGQGPTGQCQEPTTWIGLAQNVNADGTVNYAYPSSWSSTQRPTWGYSPANTSSFAFGAATMYEHDCFGHPLQSGNPNLCPLPVSQSDAVDLFNAVGAMWQDTFAFAHVVGVQNFLGTEIPISTPPLPATTLLPLSVWYSAARDDHFVTTTGCAECEGLYVNLGTIGWVYASNVSAADLAPGQTLVPLSTYYSNDYTDNILTTGAPPDGTYGFVRVEGYALATGNGSTAPLYQSVNGHHHFAVSGSAWVANATAEGFTVGGSAMGQVFTSGPEPPTKQDWYEGVLTRLDRLFGDNGLLDYYWVWTPEAWEWDVVNVTNPLVQDAVADTVAIQAAHDAIGARFKLATCGWVVGPAGARWYFDSVLPSSWVMSSIDMDVGNTPVDPAYGNLTHRDTAHKVVIPWVEDDPGLTAPELWLNRTLQHAAEAVGYGVGGLMLIHWRTQATAPQVGAALAWAWNQSVNAADYWASWSAATFGPDVGAAAATVFTGLDSYDLPRPVTWLGGPGGLQPDATQCNYTATYAWVDTLLALRPQLVAGVAAGTSLPTHLASFDYWAYQFSWMRGAALVECGWYNYNAVIAAIQGISDPSQRQQQARTVGVAARTALVQNITTAMYDLLCSVTGVEGTGTVHNVLTHSLLNAIGAVPTATLEGLTGEPLPAAAQPPSTFDPARAPQLTVQSPRSMLEAGEAFPTRALVLTTPAQTPRNVTLYVRPASTGGAWTPTPLLQAAPEGGVPRYVFTGTPASLPTGDASGFEWYVHAILPANTTAYTHGVGIPAGTIVGAAGVDLFWPPGAPAEPATVVWL